jgi:hypothetical protein
MSQPYINRLGEMVAPPPYLLGEPMTSHSFMLEADQATLQSLLDDKLNKPIPAGAHYKYQAVTDKVVLTFARYHKAESENEPWTGFLSYTEAMLGFVVRRIDPTLGGDLTGELLTYLAAVWIDDGDFKGPVEDPFTMPILRGREWYGMPKYPAAIEYDPQSPHAPKAPKVDIWDLDKEIDTSVGSDPDPEKLVLRPGIRVYVGSEDPTDLIGPGAGAPGSSGSPGSGSPDALGPPGQPEFSSVKHRLHRVIERQACAGHGIRTRLLQRVVPKVAPQDRKPDPKFHFLALNFGVHHDALDPRPVHRDLGHHESAHQLTVEGVGEVMAHADLKFRTRLVGLKEFPDPENPGDACYQAIVESPIAEKSMSPNQTLYSNQYVEFPELHRPDMDLISELGLQGFVDRRVLVPKNLMYGVTGSLVFADPSRVTVRNLYP